MRQPTTRRGDGRQRIASREASEAPEPLGEVAASCPGNLDLELLCQAGRSAMGNDARNVRGPSGEHGVEMWTARTSLRSGDALGSRRVKKTRGCDKQQCITRRLSPAEALDVLTGALA
jgi:hypothetical protein